MEERMSLSGWLLRTANHAQGINRTSLLLYSSPGVLINRKHYRKLTDFLLRFTPLRLDYKKSLEVLEGLNFMATENLYGKLVPFRLMGEHNLLQGHVPVSLILL